MTAKKKTNKFVISTKKPKRVVHEWSEYQKAIFREISGGQGNCMVIARAGSSKSSSLVEGAYHIPRGKSALFCAFSKSVAEELKGRLPPTVSARTTHSLGFGAVRNRFGNNVNVDEFKCWKIVEKLVGNPKENHDLIENICKTVSFSKANLVDTPKKIEELVDQYELDFCDLEPSEFCKLVIQTLRKCKEDTSCVDYDDQIWFCFVYGLRPGNFDFVLIDEAQDLNKAQIELCLSAVKKGGRIFAVLDDRQCVDGKTILTTDNGQKSMKALKVGERVLSFENGKMTFNTVINKVQSSETEGVRIKTKSGKSLLMSRQHKIWAEPQELKNTDHIVYLMYRADLGFRIGKTNKWKDGTARFGLRAVSESAEKLWVLDQVSSNEEAIYLEECYALEHGIPTAVFEGAKRGLNQNRIDNIFARFGQNGRKLLDQKRLDFDYPHWVSRNASTGKHKKLLVRITAHNKRKSSSVNLEYSDQETIRLINEAGIKNNIYKRRPTDLPHHTVRRFFADYSEARKFAENLAKIVGANITENFSFEKESDFRLITASGLFKGMKVLVNDGGVLVDDEIIDVQSEKGGFFDIEVERCANFFGNDIISHNCIFGWRGADSSVLQNLRNRLNPKELMLPICYRCPRKVVELAQTLVPDIQVFEKAEEGEIIDLSINDLLKTIKPGSFLLSRFNAPLIKWTFKLLKAGIPANILGRDIGDGFLYLIKKSKKKTVESFLEWLTKWEKKERERVLTKNPRANTEFLTDKAECLRMLCEDVENLEEVKKNCKNLFGNGEEKNIVQAASIHRAKGGERDDVFILADTLNETTEEEKNCVYVAWTRSKSRLFLVRKPSKWAAYDDPKDGKKLMARKGSKNQDRDFDERNLKSDDFDRSFEDQKDVSRDNWDVLD